VQDHNIRAAFDDLVAGTMTPTAVARDVGTGIELLPLLACYLERELDIDALERVEVLLKCVLRAACERPSASDARTIAEFQQRVGFLLKYKPYAVKCTNPLGYSLFLQSPGEGFSFQRHTEHKVEVFHVVDALPGGYAFLCDFDEWERDFEPESFARWLAGSPDGRYERHRRHLRPGDVIVIDQLNVVHTVVGCVLEEFATVSTDMVDRLYDQNERASIPAGFDHDFVRGRLAELAYPTESRVVYGEGSVESAPVEGGAVRVLADSFVRASAYSVDEGAAGPELEDPERAASVYVSGGSGEVAIGDEEPLAVAKGDLLTILPGVPYRATNTGAGALTFSEHRIGPDVAFLPGTT
jgi:quercetin dioxygenase-like cupin family protein